MRKLEEIFNHFVVPESAELPIPVIETKYLIDGEIKLWEGDFHAVYSPIYYEKEGDYVHYLGAYPLMGEREALAALDSAVAAYDQGRGRWPTMPVSERIACVKKFVELMTAQRDIVVKLLMWEIGKSLRDSEKEFDRTVDYINATIESLETLDRNSSQMVHIQGVTAQIRRAPLGVTLCMGPFNYPLNETFTTLIPALIMGNTIIFKPPKFGALLHLKLQEAFRDAFPKGVVNVVFGKGEQVITPIISSGKVDVLAFIGSSRVADILKKQHPHPHRLKSVLGLDAKNPAIILPDADIDNAVKECVLGALSFNGQRCTALKILFVHDQIAQSFLDKLSAAVEALPIGLPWDEGVAITPLPESGKPAYLTALIEDAVSKGARVVNENGGKTYKSLFFPAVVAGVTDTMRLFKEEQFGPIIPVVIYHDIDEPLNWVINSNYGQQASIFGRNSDQIATLIDTLVNQVCRVNLNTQCQRGPDEFPFTGRKDSAEATLSVSDALRVFSIRTLVAAKSTTENEKILSEMMDGGKSKWLRL